MSQLASVLSAFKPPLEYEDYKAHRGEDKVSKTSRSKAIFHTAGTNACLKIHCSRGCQLSAGVREESKCDFVCSLPLFFSVAAAKNHQYAVPSIHWYYCKFLHSCKTTCFPLLLPSYTHYWHRLFFKEPANLNLIWEE